MKARQKKFRLRRNRTKKKNACGETDPILFACGEKGPALIFFVYAEKKVRHRKSVGRQAAPYLRDVVKKTGFTTNRCASATFHHLFYALVHNMHEGYSKRFLLREVLWHVYVCMRGVMQTAAVSLQSRHHHENVYVVLADGKRSTSYIISIYDGIKLAPIKRSLPSMPKVTSILRLFPPVDYNQITPNRANKRQRKKYSKLN